MRMKQFLTIGSALALAATPALAHAQDMMAPAPAQTTSFDDGTATGDRTTYLLGALGIVGVIAAGIAIFDRDSDTDRPVSP